LTRRARTTTAIILGVYQTFCAVLPGLAACPLSHWERVELRVVDTFFLQAVDAAARFGGALMIRVVEPQPNGIDSAAL
jgi:hypothetical protein